MSKLDNKTKVLFFILFNLISLSLVFIFTFTPDTIHAMKSFNYSFLLVLLLAWSMDVSMEALSFKVFIKGAGDELKFADALQLTVIKNMFNIITPMNVGGHPATIYALTTRGISAGKGASIVITKMLTFAFVSLVGSVIAFYFYSKEMKENAVISKIFLASAGIFTVLVFTIAFLLLFPQILIKIVSYFGALYNKIRKGKTSKLHLKKIILHEFFLARKSINLYFKKNIKYLFFGILFTVIFYSVKIMILWIILLGMEIKIPLLRGCMFSAVQQALLAFQPTPGGAGVGDGTFYLLLQKEIPKHLMGIALVQWRFFTQYLSAIAGSVVFSLFFGKKGNSQVKKRY